MGRFAKALSDGMTVGAIIAILGVVVHVIGLDHVYPSWVIGFVTSAIAVLTVFALGVRR